jgi:MFS family permease
MKISFSPLKTVIVSVFTLGLCWVVIIPVTSAIFEERHFPTPLIGITAAVIFVGMAISAPLVGRAIELYGLKRTLFTGMCSAGILLVALSAWDSTPVWIGLRFIIGISFGAITTSCETVINRVSTDRNRGRNLGLYAFAFSLSLIAAPAAIWLLKFGIWVPFVAAGAVCFAVSVLIFVTIPHMQEESPETALDFNLARRIELSLTTNGMAGFMEGALIALIPVYSLRQGFDMSQTAILLSAFMIGHGGGPPIIGTLADRLGLRRVLALVYGLGAVVFMVIILNPAYMTLTVLLVFAGASVGALYPLAVGMIGEVLPSSELPRGNAMTTFAYGIGSILGPLLPALIMHVTAPASLFIVSATLYLIVLVSMGARKRT